MTDALSSADREAFLSEHQQWAIEGEMLQRTFVFEDFAAAMGFVTSVAIAAEAADHHPDIDVRWNKVTIGLTTHSAGALTSKDTSLAAAIERF